MKLALIAAVETPAPKMTHKKITARRFTTDNAINYKVSAATMSTVINTNAKTERRKQTGIMCLKPIVRKQHM